jgi:hypothetical protein
MGGCLKEYQYVDRFGCLSKKRNYPVARQSLIVPDEIWPDDMFGMADNIVKSRKRGIIK